MKRKHTRVKPERPRDPAAGKESPLAKPLVQQPGPSGRRSIGVWLLMVCFVVGGIWLAVWFFKSPGEEIQVAGVQGTPNLPLTSSPAVTNQTPPAPASDSLTGKERENKLNDLVNQASQLLAQNKAPEAIDLLKQARALEPEDEIVRYNLGKAMSRFGQNEEAIKEYEEALRLFPDYVEAHNDLGSLLLRVKRYDEAILHLEQAVTIDPEAASAWNNLGKAVAQLRRTTEAQACFEKAVRLDTNLWEAHFNLGTSYLQQGRLSDARTEFETVLRLQPGFGPAQQALARVERTAQGPAAPQ